MWTYQQSTGRLEHSGTDIQIGYSGHGDGLNNPAMQDVVGVGPLPQGLYTIGKSYLHPHLGPVTMNLEPSPENLMFGRSAFRIHGDNTLMNHTGSDGCMVFDCVTRCRVSDAVNAGDNQLEVVE
jgi:hypothetical protein